MTCLCMNVRSVVSKRCQFVAHIIAHNPDLVAVTETFLDNTIHDSHIMPPGYVIFRQDRNRHGGGAMLLIKNSISVTGCVDCESDCELLWVELNLKPMPVLFGVFYRPPSNSIHDLQSLRDSLSTIADHPCMILCGDFNVPHIDRDTTTPSVASQNASVLCNIVLDSYLSQMVDRATCGNNVLDVILTSRPDLVTYVSLSDNLAGCDHEAIKFEIAAIPVNKRSRFRRLYNFKKADFNEFVNVLDSTPWDHVDYGDVNKAWCMWKDLFLSAADQVIPKVTWKKT